MTTYALTFRITGYVSVFVEAENIREAMTLAQSPDHETVMDHMHPGMYDVHYSHANAVAGT